MGKHLVERTRDQRCEPNELSTQQGQAKLYPRQGRKLGNMKKDTFSTKGLRYTFCTQTTYFFDGAQSELLFEHKRTPRGLKTHGLLDIKSEPGPACRKKANFLPGTDVICCLIRLLAWF